MADDNKPKKEDEAFVLEDVSGLYGDGPETKSDPSISLQMESSPDTDAKIAPVASAQPASTTEEPSVVPTAPADDGATTVLKLDDSVQVTSAADTTQESAASAPAEGGIELGAAPSEGIVLESHSNKTEEAPAAVESEPASIEAAPSEFQTAEQSGTTLPESHEPAPSIDFNSEAATIEPAPAAEAASVESEPAPIEPAPSIDFSQSAAEQSSPSIEPAPAAQFTSDPAQDAASEAEMPYLFGKESKKSTFDPLVAMGRALGDAIVPGGAAAAPDVETLKKFLLLREQDVVALSTQLYAAIEQIKSLESQLGVEQSKTEQLESENRKQKELIDDFESKKENEIESLRLENQALNRELREKSEKTRMMDLQVRETIAEIDRIKERVRLDIRRIRVREKELENRLEVVKKDAEQLILTRETKIIDLKRKLDTVEFNMDLVKEQMAREQEKAKILKQKLMRATAAFKSAEELMSGEGEPAAQSQETTTSDPEKTVVLKAS